MHWDLLNQQIPWMAMGVSVFSLCVIGLSMSRAFVRMHSVCSTKIHRVVPCFGYLDLGTPYKHGYTCRVLWQLATASPGPDASKPGDAS